MTADLRNRVGDLDRRVGVLNRLPRVGWQRVEEGPRSLEPTYRLLVQRSARVARVEALEPRCRIGPAARIVSGHRNRGRAIPVKRTEAPRELQNRLVLPQQRV